MEQAQCWVWKQADIFRSSMNSSASSTTTTTTWEEKAFAEDAAGLGPHGGCVWPPRSYSCSFCMREFRSAQALGGHMNVHRRDRARLKQCLNPTNKILPPNNYSLRVPPIQKENILSDHSKPRDIIDQDDCSSTCLIGGDSNVETDLSVGLSFSVGLNRSFKRPRICSSFPFFLQSEEAEVTRGLMGSSMEDLDLELRLGDPPKGEGLTVSVNWCKELTSIDIKSHFSYNIPRD